MSSVTEDDIFYAVENVFNVTLDRDRVNDAVKNAIENNDIVVEAVSVGTDALTAGSSAASSSESNASLIAGAFATAGSIFFTVDKTEVVNAAGAACSQVLDKVDRPTRVNLCNEVRMKATQVFLAVFKDVIPDPDAIPDDDEEDPPLPDPVPDPVPVPVPVPVRPLAAAIVEERRQKELSYISTPFFIVESRVYKPAFLSSAKNSRKAKKSPKK